MTSTRCLQRTCPAITLSSRVLIHFTERHADGALGKKNWLMDGDKAVRV